MLRTILVLTCITCTLAAWSQHHTIVVHLDTAAKQAMKGRLYIYSTTDTSKTVQEPDPFNPSPTFYLDVNNWKGGETKTIDSTAPAYPVKLSQLKPGFYKFAALLDTDNTERAITTAGNWYSRDVLAEIKAGSNTETHIYLNRIFPARPFRESDSVQQVSMKSRLLSDFHKKPVAVVGAVVLPRSYAKDSNQKYPVVFIIPGWGGTHYDIFNPNMKKRYGIGMGKDKIYVYLNPETQTTYGLHAFIDSRVNGPWGKALVEELVPYLQQHYRINTDPKQHFIAGQSSGGYAALWLHLNYPKAFGGSWAVSPDPVDFGDFTSVNLYAKNANMYTDAAGKDRPFFLWNGQYVSTIKRYASFEHFLGDGGQMQSFEAAFGKPGKDGRPKEMFDRQTGAIHQHIVKEWQPYDLGAYLEKNYRRLANDIAGRVHVYAGAEDNFYLDRSVQLLKDKAAKIDADIAAELIPGANHWSIWSEAFTKRVQQEMDALIP